ncbi:MAG: GAF domain-containing protein [candidate division Zixibacteria bacterium]|nr:GAF domain-containing protein [candidate division Zixibacteria bacterium]
MESERDKSNSEDTQPVTVTGEGTASGTATIPEDFLQSLDKIADYNQAHISQVHYNTFYYIHQLEQILKTSTAINGVLDIDEILKIAMGDIVTTLKAERGFITLYDDRRRLQVKTVHNMKVVEITDRTSFDYDHITALVLGSGRAVISSDVARDERFSHLVSSGVFPQHSLLCVPLTNRSEILGTLYLENHHKSRIFIESDLHLLNLYARILSGAVAVGKAYQAAVNHDNYNRSVIKNAPVGAVIVAPDGRLAAVNQAALEIFDLNAENIVTLESDTRATNFIEILPVSEKPAWSKMINTVLTTQQGFRDARYSHNTGYLEKVLSVKIEIIRPFPYCDYGLVLLIEDITEQVLMEKYVIFTEKLVARGEMAARVAHKLNNFLTVIANNIELLKMNLERKKNDKVNFNAGTILDQVFKIKQFLESLTEAPRLETGYISFNINHLINDLLFSLHNEPKFKEILFTLELEDHIPNIEIDVDRIKHALLNLLNNAVEAVEEEALNRKDSEFKKSVRLTTAYNQSHERIVITVADNGAGIKKKHLAKIFKQHFTTKKNRHGLGLYDCRVIIEQHRGKIEVDSNPGEGTAFTVTLPRFQPKITA